MTREVWLTQPPKRAPGMASPDAWLRNWPRDKPLTITGARGDRITSDGRDEVYVYNNSSGDLGDYVLRNCLSETRPVPDTTTELAVRAPETVTITQQVTRLRLSDEQASLVAFMLVRAVGPGKQVHVAREILEALVACGVEVPPQEGSNAEGTVHFE